MADYSAIAEQTVNGGGPIIFTESPTPCGRGMVLHRDGTGTFLLKGVTRCPRRNAEYSVMFGANVAIPEGGTVGPITVGVAIDGTVIPASIMEVTPTVAQAYTAISKMVDVPIWAGCCETVSIVNTGADPILVKQADVEFTRPDLLVSR